MLEQQRGHMAALTIKILQCILQLSTNNFWNYFIIIII